LDTSSNNALVHQVQDIVFKFPQYHTSDPNDELYDAFADIAGTSFALIFKTTLNETFTTYPLKMETSEAHMATQIASALESLPNGVIDDVVVSSTAAAASNVLDPQGNSYGKYMEIKFHVTFQGNTVQGPQNLLTIVDHTCGTGCTPKLVGIPIAENAPLSYVKETTLADYNNYECGRRGKCDYESGLCACFDGYTGESCATQTALI